MFYGNYACNLHGLRDIDNYCWSENANCNPLRTLYDTLIGDDPIEFLAKLWYSKKLEGCGYDMALTA